MIGARRRGLAEATVPEGAPAAPVTPAAKPAGRGGSRRRALAAGLAARIVAHARTEGVPPGSQLKEQHLADALRVSRTPIREALRLLESTQVVESRPNRGFFLLDTGERALQAVQSLDSQTEDPAYVRIAEDRLDGVLPSRVSESEMIRRYGLAPSHLQRLLARMTREGWVERLPGQGWEFQPILDSPHALERSYRFRMLVEPAALLEPEYHLSPAALQRLVAQQEADLAGRTAHLTPSEVFERGAAFHETIVGASGNPFLLDAIRRVNRLRRLIEYRLPTPADRRRTQSRDNLKLLRMLEAGQQAEAAEFLRRHLDEARRRKTKLADGLVGGTR